MPCSMYARQTGAVPSGRRVIERPPLSSKVYISFCTTSVDSPTPRANSSVASNVGVSMRRYPAAPRMRRAASSTASRRVASSGSTSYVPRGAWTFALMAARRLSRERLQEGVGRALGAERREAHVTRVDDGLVRVGAEQLGDRLQQARVVAAGQVGAADRPLEEDVAGEDRGRR